MIIQFHFFANQHSSIVDLIKKDYIWSISLEWLVEGVAGALNIFVFGRKLLGCLSNWSVAKFEQLITLFFKLLNGFPHLLKFFEVVFFEKDFNWSFNIGIRIKETQTFKVTFRKLLQLLLLFPEKANFPQRILLFQAKTNLIDSNAYFWFIDSGHLWDFSQDVIFFHFLLKDLNHFFVLFLTSITCYLSYELVELSFLDPSYQIYGFFEFLLIFYI